MATFRLSKRAQTDLLSIAQYSERTSGQPQAQRYVGEIQSCCSLLADRPELGRAFDARKPETLRMEQGSHVIFYRGTPGGLFVQRILHKSMLPGRHAF